ncbi:Glutathione S-transferase [Metarhizium album ARSEF 1941]|uniref:Glutathione S-transferase n=1 Tax=Metarhizium album (strain ARSEF 1941) TaxID=1081103 RepID=A0A0B2WY36_METAS|nr:Glutathione S-transferase [Metarhizium album ARSEF 1941]KHN98514.1 Glutathione S-transferase [Metarhizium album ARSEF 1941]
MAAPGSLPGSGAGRPGAGQFRLDIGVGIEGYPGLNDACRPFNGAAPSASPRQSGAPGGGQFGILAPATMPSGVAVDGHLDGAQETPPGGKAQQRRGTGRIVVDPPDLRAWREKLFNVNDMIVLTDEQFETYFPHVDNVYSHRSTQRYKRKPFVSHYWDCRMKGRPPGTPKSDDPSKRKRKRSARARDLCDVKIRITEYFPNASAYVDREAAAAAAAAGSALPVGQRFWTIQRVNGNGGNGKSDGVAGPHRHTLERSDDIKKNSVQRYVAQQEKQVRKTQKAPPTRATGAAATLVKKRSKEHDLKLYSSSKGLAYQYCEVEPSKTPPLTASTQAGLAETETAPTIRQGDWSCSESAVILEYLEDMDKNTPLLPVDSRLKAKCRLWIYHVSKIRLLALTPFAVCTADET